MAFLNSVAYVILLGIAAHYIGEALPERWLKYEYALFRPRKWEHGGVVYERIRVQDWKDHMPDMSRVMKDMVPKKIGICPTSDEIWTLVRETCRAEAVHLGLCLCAPVVYFFWWNKIGIFLSGLVIVCNLPFIVIQRYNRPMFIRLAIRLEAREERKKYADTHFIG
ncbi:MAG: hypothetical protein IKC31_03940 [Clostridia bacterium]|nr:hypothetical protein [Clostridia bacterium]MBR2926709.1 hypothetical protein [Clostridia bacterium]